MGRALTGGMFYGGVGVCSCHGEPWHLSAGRRGRQKRQCIFKVRAQWTRRDARRDKTPERMAWKAESNAKRVRFGAGGLQFFVGMASAPDQAKTIRQLARENAPKRGAA